MIYRSISGLVAVGLVFGLTLLASAADEARALAQPHDQAVEGLPMMLPDGRLVIFGAAGNQVVVLRVMSVGKDRPPLLDLETGDVIIEFQGIGDPDVASFRTALAGTAPGQSLRLGVRRGTDEHRLEFPKTSSTLIVPKDAVKGEGGPPRAAADIAAEVQRLLAEASPADGPGMTLAVWLNGKVAVSAARGLASLETGRQLGPEAVLPIASVSKEFTALAIALLVDRGEISLDDDARRFLPELSGLGQKVTVRNLLTHTSGLKDYTGLLSLTGWEFGDGFSTEELLTLVGRQRELQFRPGTEHRYSNTNYALLAVVVERIVGMSFGEWMQDEVFAPLGMDATSFPATAGAIIPMSANLYRPIDGGFERAPGGHELAGAGGMMSTSLDLLRWGRELLVAEHFDPSVMELMQQPTVLEDGSEIGYGLGLGVEEFRGVPRLAHSGSGPGSASVLQVYPQDDLAIAILANSGGAEVFALAEEIAALYLGDRLGSESQGPGAYGPGAFMITDEQFAGEGNAEGVPIDSETVASFAGRYVLEEEDRDLILEAAGSTLLLKVRQDIPGVPLVHLGGGRFLFPPARWEISIDQSTRPAQRIVLHLTEDSIQRGEPRDVTGYRSDVRELTAADRESLIGTYVSPELGVAYRILEQDDALYLEHPRLGRLPLTHHSGDTFGLPGKQVARVWFLHADPDDPASAITGLVAEAYAWSATARFDRLDH